MTTPIQQFVTPDGDTVTYKVFGDENPGETLVLLPGIGNSINMWGAVPDLLARSSRVVAVDVPGFGGSSAPSLGYTVDQIVRNLDLAITSLARDSYVLIGHSLGGLVALALSETRPNYRRIILVSGFPKSALELIKSPHKAPLRPALALNLVAQICGGSLAIPEDLRRVLFGSALSRWLTLSPFVADPSAVDPELLIDALDGTGSLNALRVLLLADEFQPVAALERFPGRVSLVIGDADDLHTESDLLPFANDPTRSLHELEGVGHWPQVEDPEALVKALRATGG